MFKPSMITINGYTYINSFFFRQWLSLLLPIDFSASMSNDIVYIYISMHTMYIYAVIDTGCALIFVSLTCRRLHVLCQCKIEWRAIRFLVIYFIDFVWYRQSSLQFHFPIPHSLSLSLFLCLYLILFYFSIFLFFVLNFHILFPKLDIKQKTFIDFHVCAYVHACVCAQKAENSFTCMHSNGFLISI